MTSFDTDRLIESVVRITGQRDRETLESCLVSTLQALVGARRVTLVRAFAGDEQILAEEMASSTPGRASAKESAVPVDGHPLFGRLVGLDDVAELSGPESCSSVVVCPYSAERGNSRGWLIVESDQPLAAHQPLIAGMAAIYGNYLTIIDDTENDTLTGLRNRKTFDERIGRILALAQQQRAAHGGGPADRRHHEPGDSYWLGVLDIDHFKRVNDTYGHVFGDEVLLLFAQIMRRAFRSDDLLFRYGGEEFVVVLSPVSAEGAANAFEKLRAAVEAFEFPQIGQITTSIGYVRIADQFIPAEAVGHADEALYFAKRNGRNRVCRYEDLVAEGILGTPVHEGEVELF